MKKGHLLLILAFLFFLFQVSLLSQSQEGFDVLGKCSQSVVSLKAWDKNKNVVGEGTGFAIEENLIVVPYHLVSQAFEAEVTSIAGKTSKVEAMVAAYRKYDLALLRIKGKIPPLSTESASRLQQDEKLYAISEVGEQVLIADCNFKGWIELGPEKTRIMEIFSRTLEKPSCGAPLINHQGKVVGVALIFDYGVKFGIPAEEIMTMNTQAKGRDLKEVVKDNYFELEEGCNLIGKAAARLNEPMMATNYLQKYIKFKPDDFESYLFLGRAYYRLGNNDESYKNFARALLLDPENSQALYGLGQVLLKQRKFKEAIEYLEKAAARNIEVSEIYFELGTACEELQDLAKAAEYYEKYARSVPTSFAAWLKLAQTYQRLNQPEKAIAAYREALKLSPNDINSNYNLAKLLAESRQLEEAEIIFVRLATAINPKEAIFYYSQILQMYERVKNYQKAVEAAKKIVDLSPGNEVAVYNLAIMYFQMGQLEEAASTLNKCLEIKNDYSAAWFNLGLVYDRMKKHAEAVEAFKKYAALAPDDPNGWLNIGLEYMLLKDFEKALPNLEKAVSLDPNNPVSLYNLGITFINLKDNYSAREVLKNLRRLDPNLAARLEKLIK